MVPLSLLEALRHRQRDAKAPPSTPPPRPQVGRQAPPSRPLRHVCVYVCVTCVCVGVGAVPVVVLSYSALAVPH